MIIKIRLEKAPPEFWEQRAFAGLCVRFIYSGELCGSLFLPF
jgi:hypothetical protein